VNEQGEPAGDRAGRRLIIWRHGQTAWNAAGRIQGQLDTELSELGIAQAARAAERLAELHPDAIVSSDLKRASDTASALAKLTGLAVSYDPRLRERFFGDWQGLTDDELAERFPEDFARWRSGQHHLGGYHIEGFEEFGKRAAEAFLAATELGRTVVAASHGGTAKYGVAALLGWPHGMLATVSALGNCRWIELRADARRGWVMRAYNIGF
jgi:probable phosphoglycerate mutase